MEQFGALSTLDRLGEVSQKFDACSMRVFTLQAYLCTGRVLMLLAGHSGLCDPTHWDELVELVELDASKVSEAQE